MKEYVNFYENMKEACMRLANTVVLYDGKPYYVLCITNHKSDGVFRIYLDDMSREDGMALSRVPGIPYEWHDGTNDFVERGKKMDAFLDANPDCGIIRKMMNSPAFNKYRPFPLGMCNWKGQVFYLSRNPTRHTQQGLTNSMLSVFRVALEETGPLLKKYRDGPNTTCYEAAQTILGNYPSIEECFVNMSDPTITNSGAAFSRDFAFVRGPLGLLFLAYREDIIGYLPDNSEKNLMVGGEFRYVKESIEDLNFFSSITFKE